MSQATVAAEPVAGSSQSNGRTGFPIRPPATLSPRVMREAYCVGPTGGVVVGSGAGVGLGVGVGVGVGVGPWPL